MPLDTSVDTTPDDGAQHDVPSLGLYGWDWSATTHEAADGIVNDLIESMGYEYVLPGGGIQGWSQSVVAYDGLGYKLGTVYFGGGRDDVHVLATSEVADETRTRVAGIQRARTARVDTRVDSLVSFDDLTAIMEDAAQTYGSTITTMESKQRGQSLGRTVYLGAPSSAIRVRLYEKWLESPGMFPDGEHVNRVEVQLRPASRVKARVTGWSRAETFCASKVTRRLAELLGADLVPKNSLHVAKPTPDLERTLEVMGQQYGGAVERWLKLSKGDITTVLDHLLTTTTQTVPS